METRNRNVEHFVCSGINLLGNFSNGCLVGLTERGAALWNSYTSGTIDDEHFASADPELFSILTKYGFCKQPATVSSPTSAYIHVTERCNLSCVGCYSRSGVTKPDPTSESLEAMLGFLKRHQIESVHISGGEPFLREDLSRVVRFAKERIRLKYIDIATNGTIYSNEALRAIAQYVDLICVSIGSYQAESRDSIKGDGLFETVMENVQSIINLGINVCLIPTIHSKNYNDIPHYIDLAQRIGAGINFSILSCSACNRNLGKYAFDSQSLDGLAGTLLHLMQSTKRMPSLVARKSCRAGVGQISLDVSGNIYPCHMLQSPTFLMGNALKGEFFNRSSYSPELKKVLTFDVDGHLACRSCEYHNLCGGGCLARSFCSNSSLDSADPYCSLLKSFFFHSLHQLRK